MRRITAHSPDGRGPAKTNESERRVEWFAAASRPRPSLVGTVTFPQIVVGGADRTEQ